MNPLLSVENLRIAFPSRQGPVEVVRGVSFSLGRERLGIVGESGSGKSQTGRAILGLTPVTGTATADRLCAMPARGNGASCAAPACRW